MKLFFATWILAREQREVMERESSVNRLFSYFEVLDKGTKLDEVLKEILYEDTQGNNG